MRCRAALVLLTILASSACHSTHAPPAPQAGVGVEQAPFGPCTHCNEWTCNCNARIKTFPEPIYHGYQCTTWRAIPDPCEFQTSVPAMQPVPQPSNEDPSLNRLPPIEFPPDAQQLRTTPIQPT
jgi:hypothetical protein